jgi:hypothetical protein
MMMVSSCYDKRIIPLNNDNSRTGLSSINPQQQYNNYGAERPSGLDVKTGAEQLFFVENIPYNHISARFLGFLRRL